MPRTPAPTSKFDHLYEPCELPDADTIRWRPKGGKPLSTHTVLYSIGGVYKLIRTLATGEVAYFKLKDEADAVSPPDKIDAEPAKPAQVRYNVGKHCWLILDGRWFCCEVMSRENHTIELRPVTGWDADRTTAWPHGETLAFSSRQSSPLFKQLRPLKARQT